jgi:chromosome segregation ATPase
VSGELYQEIRELQSAQGGLVNTLGELQNIQGQQGNDIMNLEAQQNEAIITLTNLDSTHGKFLEELRANEIRRLEEVASLQREGGEIKAAHDQLTNDLGTLRTQLRQESSKVEAFQHQQGIEIATLKLQHTKAEAGHTQLRADVRELQDRAQGAETRRESREASPVKGADDIIRLRSFCQDEITCLRNAHASLGEAMNGLHNRNSIHFEAIESQHAKDLEDLRRGQTEIIEAVQTHLKSNLGSIRKLRQGAAATLDASPARGRSPASSGSNIST